MKKAKNPASEAAAMLGRLGGFARAKALTPAEMSKAMSKAGRARAAKLSARKRSAIAKAAAKARWRKGKHGNKT